MNLWHSELNRMRLRKKNIRLTRVEHLRKLRERHDIATSSSATTVPPETVHQVEMMSQVEEKFLTPLPPTPPQLPPSFSSKPQTISSTVEAVEDSQPMILNAGETPAAFDDSERH